MRTVHKYPLAGGTGEHVIPMPAGALLLTIQLQGGMPCLWALIDTERELVKRHLTIVGTGWEMQPQPGRYVGTFQTEGGRFVWHVFDADPISGGSP